ALPIELLAYFVVTSRQSPVSQSYRSLAFLVSRMFSTELAVLAHLDSLCRLLLVLRRAVVPALALLASHRNDVSHGANLLEVGGLRLDPLASDLYSRISVIVPEPTVRPPSRMAKRDPFSIATGTISSPVIVVLSPGITISTPSGSFSVP